MAVVGLTCFRSMVGTWATLATVLVLCAVVIGCGPAAGSKDTVGPAAAGGTQSGTPEIKATERPMSAEEILASCSKSLVIIRIIKDGEQVASGLGFVAVEQLPEVPLGELETRIESMMRRRAEGGSLSTLSCGIVTCDHFFEIEGFKLEGEIVVEFAGSRLSYLAVVQATDKSRDLALLRVRYMAKTPIPSLAFSDAQTDVGANVFAVGLLEEGPLTIMAGKTLKQNSFFDGNKYQMTTCETTHDYAGGPVLNDRGRLVGVITDHHTDKIFPGLAIDVADLRDFLAAATKPAAGKKSGFRSE